MIIEADVEETIAMSELITRSKMAGMF